MDWQSLHTRPLVLEKIIYVQKLQKRVRNEKISLSLSTYIPFLCDYNTMLACYTSLHTMHILATTLDMNNLSLLFDNKHQNPLWYIIFNHLTSEGIPWHMINPMRPKVTLNTQRSRIFSNIDMLLHQTTYWTKHAENTTIHFIIKYAQYVIWLSEDLGVRPPEAQMGTPSKNNSMYASIE